MDIAAMSTMLSQANLQQQVSISVMKMAMDAAKVQAVDLTQMLQESTKAMELSVNPHLGTNIDIKI